MPVNKLLDVSHLQTFVMIADSRSLTEAATRLGVTQSAVSQTLKQLEASLGVELVIRRTQPVRLTAAGNVLQQGAAHVLGQLHRLSAQVRDAANTGFVQCRIGMVSSCTEVFAGQLLEQLDIQTEQLIIRSGTSPILRQAFLNREIDILISDEALSEDTQLQRHYLCRDPMLALVAKPHTTGNGGSENPLSIQQLAKHQAMVKFSRATHLGAYSEVVLRRMHLSPQVHYEADDTHTLTSFVKQGHTWAMLSAISLAQVLDRIQGLQVLEIEQSRHARELYLLSRTGEMGELPTQLSALFQQTLQDSIVPLLQTHAPWLSTEVFNLES